MISLYALVWTGRSLIIIALVILAIAIAIVIANAIIRYLYFNFVCGEVYESGSIRTIYYSVFRLYFLFQFDDFIVEYIIFG